MRKQKHHRRLPALTDYRLRRLRTRLPLDVLAVAADIPSASLSRFERDEATLTPEQLARLDQALQDAEEPGP